MFGERQTGAKYSTDAAKGRKMPVVSYHSSALSDDQPKSMTEWKGMPYRHVFSRLKTKFLLLSLDNAYRMHVFVIGNKVNAGFR